MDVCSLGFMYSEAKDIGRKPYDPSDMFKIYAYSYFNGIRSSRKIERECYRNIELIWLISDIRPDFKTICDFRKDNKAQIKAHRSNCEKYMKLLDICDNEESDQPKLSKKEITNKIDSINKRIAELEVIKQDVIESGSIYETDSDSRMMCTNNNGGNICYNVQMAVDENNHLVVAVDAVSEPIDKEQLYNMALQAKENMQVSQLAVIADRGYYSAKQFKMCDDESIRTYVPKMITGQSETPEFDKEKFVFDEEKGGYVCPAGALLLPLNWKMSGDREGCIKYAMPMPVKVVSKKTSVRPQNTEPFKTDRLRNTPVRLVNGQRAIPRYSENEKILPSICLEL